MAKTTDESDIPAFHPEKIEGVVQALTGLIMRQADSAEEAYTMAFGVFAQLTRDIKPEYRDAMVEKIGEALRVFWKAQDERERRSVN